MDTVEKIGRLVKKVEMDGRKGGTVGKMEHDRDG